MMYSSVGVVSYTSSFHSTKTKKVEIASTSSEFVASSTQLQDCVSSGDTGKFG